jgi:hypothetical protein
MAIVDEALMALHKKKICILVTLDLKKAFNSVFRPLLLAKMREAGIDTTWFEDYLWNRFQRVKYGGDKFSSLRADTYGLPQGTVLGPILFSIFINDLPGILKSTTTYLFADDNTLLITGFPDDVAQLILKLEEDIELVVRWLDSNMLQLNSLKTECIVIGSPHNLKKIGRIKIRVANSVIESQDCIRILGLKIDNQLSWHQHVQSLARKCYSQLRPLYMIKQIVTPENLVILAQSLVLSNLNNMCVIWGTADQSTLKALDKIVKSAAKLVLNKRRSDSVLEELTESLRWLMPKFLHQKSLMCTVHKLINCSRSPAYFRERITYNSEIHRHNTRSRDEIHIPIQPKTKYGTKAFIHNGFKLWNFYLETQPEILALGYAGFSRNMKKLLISQQLNP